MKSIQNSFFLSRKKKKTKNKLKESLNQQKTSVYEKKKDFSFIFCVVE